MPPLAQLSTVLRERLGEVVRNEGTELGWDVLDVVPERIADVLTVLKEQGYDMLTDLSGTDWLPAEPRFHVNYHLYSFPHNVRLRVKVRVSGDEPHVPSVTGVHPGANFQEREVFDLMGVVFDGHPDLRRIMMPDEWIGHPQRKDYPTGGVPVEYKIDPAYIGPEEVTTRARPAAGGVPPRLTRDRGQKSRWTWTGKPASEVRKQETPGSPRGDAAPEAADREKPDK